MATKKSPSKSAGKATAKKAAPKKAAPKKAASNNSRNATVKPKSDAAEGLRDLFLDELKDIYWAEKALTKALPKMAKNATDEQLKSSILEHLEVTQNQVQRAEEVFGILGEKAQAKKCEAMDGLLKEGQEIMESTEPGPVRDAGIISACQKVEHYEIASYGTLAAFARILGEEDAAELLEETLQEEKDADQTLTDCAENAVNIEANEEDDDDEEDESDDEEEDDEE